MRAGEDSEARVYEDAFQDDCDVGLEVESPAKRLRSIIGSQTIQHGSRGHISIQPASSTDSTERPSGQQGPSSGSEPLEPGTDASPSQVGTSLWSRMYSGAVAMAASATATVLPKSLAIGFAAVPEVAADGPPKSTTPISPDTSPESAPGIVVTVRANPEEEFSHPNVMMKEEGADTYQRYLGKIVSRGKYLSFNVVPRIATTAFKVIYSVGAALPTKLANFLTQDDEPVFISLYYLWSQEVGVGNKLCTTVASGQLPRPTGNTGERKDGWFTVRCEEGRDNFARKSGRMSIGNVLRVRVESSALKKPLDYEWEKYEKCDHIRMKESLDLKGGVMEFTVTARREDGKIFGQGNMIFVINAQQQVSRI